MHTGYRVKGQWKYLEQIMNTYKLAYPPSHLPMIPFLRVVSVDLSGKAEEA
jgi:hypothetical protein